MKNAFWKIFKLLLMILQPAAGILLLYQADSSNLFPEKYLYAGAAAFMMLYVATVFLWRKHGRIAAVLAVLAVAVCVALTSAVQLAQKTMQEIGNQNTQGFKVAVYVREDSAAESLSDVKNGVFGRNSVYDVDNTNAAQQSIEKELGRTIKTSEYEYVTQMIDALYSGKIDALILNEAYTGVLENQESYEDFSTKTRIIYEYDAEMKVEENTIEEPAGNVISSSFLEQPFMIYISGSDSLTDDLSMGRSDVNLIAAVNPQTKQVLLINTPRDYYVRTSMSGKQKDKLTHAGIYGIQCSMDTLGMLYDEDISYYMQINFTGFQTLIDAIGGITVDVDEAGKTDDGFYFSEGFNEMNGEQALSFVRERHHYSDGDAARGRHQMAMITALIGKISSGSTILMNYTDIMNSLQGMFATNVDSDDIAAFVKMQLNENPQWTVKSYAVSGSGARETTYSAPGQPLYVMIPDEETVEHAAELIDRIYAGDILTDEDIGKIKEVE